MKVDPPFASDGGVARSPTTDEQAGGFPCGAADQELFNRLHQGVQAEFKAVLDAGGITGIEEDDTGLLQAIMALISAATGGGDTSEYILFTQAQNRFPIFPEVTTNNGIIIVTTPATGTVRVPAGASILHRGIGLYTSALTDFATTANKTYHVRWNRTDGFSLKDLADVTYNPAVLDEADESFDSTFDDMLVARVVTNSSNVATVTNLQNKASLDINVTLEGQNLRNANNQFEKVLDFEAEFNWARTPRFRSFNWHTHWSLFTTTASDGDFFLLEYGAAYTDTKLTSIPISRYNTRFAMLHDDWDTTMQVIYDGSFGA